jgi:ADP-dependent NAD(P)H-hydrate dehydratase / NAD(P)H-hydrate epimerase
MIPVVTPEEMRAIDAASTIPVAALIERAGAAVAQAAIEMLGGTYGRRVVVLVGKGNNGADGRVAARRLLERGVRVELIDMAKGRVALAAPVPCDLVIDAALGTGARPGFLAPALQPNTRVLAVDIPSGLDAATGKVPENTSVLAADVTVTFAAAKPGQLFADGARLCGELRVAHIGLGVGGPNAPVKMHIIECSDVRRVLPRRATDAHKWASAVLVVGGSAGMTGAPLLAARGSYRGGAGMVRVAVPGDVVGGDEVVGVRISAERWASEVLDHVVKCRALVIGPGLGRSGVTRTAVRQVLSRAECAAVVDADALFALGDDGAAQSVAAMMRDRAPSAGGKPADEAQMLLRNAGKSRDDVGNLLPGQRAVLQATARRMGATPVAAAKLGRVSEADLEHVVRALAGRPANATVLTPHDGEFERLVGHRPSPDASHIEEVRRLAAATGAIVLLKGPTTVVGEPDGRVALVTNGDERLATAGSGDVLAGVIGALLAQGVAPFEAAWAGAWLHGHAATLGPRHGLVAGDLPLLVAAAIGDVAGNS